MVTSKSEVEIYQLHVWIRQINPMIWRRLLVRSDSTIADLHYTLQIAFGWSDEHLHQFRIHGQAYGVYHDGGINFSKNPGLVKLSDFKFRKNERFIYEYDFGDFWEHSVRLEARLPAKEGKSYPYCIDGQRRAPPEDCGGPSEFMAQLDEVPILEYELLEDIEDALPPPGPPFTVGLDGGYVHASDQKSRAEGWFEVITGKSIKTEGGGAKVFAFVNKYDTKPKRRLHEVLKAQGLQMNQQVVFLSDGGDTVRGMQAYLSPESEHLLDWFHITMRLTVMGQLVKGMGTELKPDGRYPLTTGILASLGKNLESVKWNLWHGNVAHALQRMDDLDDDLETLEETPQNKKKLERAVKELRGYISANEAFIPNYGDRYRHDEMISTAFVESTVNQVISKRFVKKQQMRWTQRGAHLLLQTRVQVLNEDLRNTFCRWFPGMNADHHVELKAA